MDSAIYDSTDNIIIGVRGSRVYKCDPATGAVISQSDYAPLGFGPANIVWDQGTNKCFASAWNTSHWDPANFGSALRYLYRIVPTTLTVDLISELVSTFGLPNTVGPVFQGIVSMKNIGGTIFAICPGYGAVTSDNVAPLKFLASNLATHTAVNPGIAGTNDYPSMAYGNIGGHDVIFWYSMENTNSFQKYDFTSSAFSNIAQVDSNPRLALEYDSATGKLFITREFQFVDVFTTAGALSSTINTARANFNGVQIQRNPNDGLIYAAGGGDNTVAVITPATNAVTIKTGFDLPVNFVFTPAKKFAVQAGSSPLKEIT